MKSEPARALLLQKTVLDTVAAAQISAAKPVTSAVARRFAPHLAGSARAFCKLARAVVELGADPHGRRLISAGQTHSAQSLWLVLSDGPQQRALQLEPYAPALAELAAPGEPPEAAAGRLLSEAIQVNRSLRQRAAAALAGGQPSAPAANPLPPPPLPQQKAPEQPTELRADPIRALISSAQARLDAPAPGLAALESALQQPPEPEPDDPMALALTALAELNAEASR